MRPLGIAESGCQWEAPSVEDACAGGDDGLAAFWCGFGVCGIGTEHDDDRTVVISVLQERDRSKSGGRTPEEAVNSRTHAASAYAGTP